MMFSGMPRWLQVQHAAGLVQQSHHHRLAVLDGHGGQTHVDGAALDLDVEAPVLGQALLGDVQARHELQAQHHRIGDALLVHHLFLQHAVDALADAQRVLVGLDVDVRGAHLHGVLEQALQQLDHRRIGDLVAGAELRHVEVTLGQFLAQLLGQVADLLRAPVHRIEGAQQVRLAHHGRIHRPPQQARHLVEGEDVRGVGHAHQVAVSLLGQRYAAETPRRRLGQAVDQVTVEAVMAQIHQRDGELARQQIEQGLLVDEAHLDERAAQLVPGLLLGAKGLLQLLVGDDAVLHQQIAQADLLARSVGGRHAHRTSSSAARRSRA
jgi:hypothetical protein